MNSEPRLPAEEQVESLVRAYLSERERAVDARAVLAGVRERLAVESAVADLPVSAVGAPPRRWRAVRRRLLGLASAAAVLLALFLGYEFGTSPASAETLITAARARAEEPVDRLYAFRLEMNPEAVERDPLLPPLREGELWARGNQVYVKPVAPRPGIGWGRDTQGRVWIAHTRHAGIRFGPDEVPPPLALACDLRSMEVETLLRELLNHFDLTREGPVPGKGGPVQVVRALLKPEHRHRSLRGARLEIDARTNVLRRVVLYRTQATLSFTYVRSAPADDTRFQMETYLDPDARINARNQPLPRRLDMLRRFQKNPQNEESRGTPAEGKEAHPAEAKPM